MTSLQLSGTAPTSHVVNAPLSAQTAQPPVMQPVRHPVQSTPVTSAPQTQYTPPVTEPISHASSTSAVKTPESSNNNNNMIWIVIAVLVLVLFLGALYYYWKQKQKGCDEDGTEDSYENEDGETTHVVFEDPGQCLYHLDGVCTIWMV